MLDPEKANAVGSVLDHDVNIIMRAKIRFDGDGLPVTRRRRLAAFDLATHFARVVGGKPPLEGESERAEIAVNSSGVDLLASNREAGARPPTASDA